MSKTKLEILHAARTDVLSGTTPVRVIFRTERGKVSQNMQNGEPATIKILIIYILHIFARTGEQTMKLNCDKLNFFTNLAVY